MINSIFLIFLDFTVIIFFGIKSILIPDLQDNLACQLLYCFDRNRQRLTSLFYLCEKASGEEGANGTDEPEEEEPMFDDLFCVACNKPFRTEKQ